MTNPIRHLDRWSRTPCIWLVLILLLPPAWSADAWLLQETPPVVPSGVPAPVAKTGAAFIPGYTLDNREDGYLRPGVALPRPRFRDNVDGTITDNATGLVWLKNANAFATRTWTQALADCAGLASGTAGLTDGSTAGQWRLPNRVELASLVDYGRVSPVLTQGFPFASVQTNIYWTSTSDAGTTGSAWCLNLDNGVVGSVDKAGSDYVWPVRTGVRAGILPVPTSGAGDLPGYTEDAHEDATTQPGLVWPTPRFTDNNNGTVTDNLTRLVWLKNANPTGPRTWTQALTDCASLQDGTNGLTDGTAAGRWHLPTIRELRSLLSARYANPAVANATGTAQWSTGDPFTAVQSSFYWSGTSDAGASGNAWYVGFSGGAVASIAKGGTAYVWPVRGTDGRATPTVTAVGSGSIYAGQTAITVTGTNFGPAPGSGRVELTNSITYASTTRVQQTVTNWTDTAITITCNRSTLPHGALYLFVTNDAIKRNAGYAVTLLPPTWDGGGADNNWSTAANWVGDVAPLAGDDLIFSGSSRLTISNDYPGDTAFGSITFNATAGAFVISGNAIALGGSITNGSTAPQTVNLLLSLAVTRTIDAASGDITLGGTRSGAGGLTKIGVGTLTLTGTDNEAGATTVSSGTLAGTATMMPSVTLQAGTTIAPGTGGTTVSTLTAGSVTMDATSVYRVDLSASTGMADCIAATGTVTCTGTLTVASLSGTPTAGTVYTIISGASVTGTLTGLANNSTFTQQSRTFQIVYTSTAVMLCDVTGVTAVARIWNGGGNNDNWTTAANWVGGVAPLLGDYLIFAGTTRLTPNNDYATDTTFDGITFSAGAGAFTIGGNRFILNGGLATYASNQETMTLDIAGTAWTPAQLATELWLDANDVDGDFQSSNNPANGTAISQWNDKSGHGRHVSQGTAIFQPTYATAGINGLGVIIFNGVNNGLANAAVGLPTGTQSRSAFVVYQPLRTTGINAITSQGNPAGPGQLFTMEYRDNPAGDPYFHGGYADATNYAAPNLNIKMAAVTFSATTLNLFENGALVATSYLNLNTSGDSFFVGTSVSNELAMAKIAEIVYVNGAISATNRQYMEGYLAHKWGLTALLPAGHPYRSTVINIPIVAASGNLVLTGTTSLSVGSIYGPGSITLPTGSSLTPGSDGALTTITAGSVTMSATSTFRVDLDATTASSDRLTSAGTVVCSGNLAIATLRGNPTAGTVYTILSGTSVTGTFTGLANGSTFTQQSRTFQIFYGSTAVMLCDITGMTASAKLWTGGGSDNNWSTAANWLGNVAPVSGDCLIFGGSTRLSPSNDYPTDTSFGSITFSAGAGAFTLSGNRIALCGSITNHATAQQILALDVSDGSTFWTPASMATDLWLDANDINGNFLTNDNPANGTSISLWTDKSGNRRNVWQVTANYQPLYTTGAINGLGAITFNGTTHGLSNTTVGLPVGAQGRSAFVVYKPMRTTGTNVVFAQGTSANNTWFSIHFRPSPAGDPYFAGYYADLTDSASPNLAIKLADVVFDGTAGAVFRNGSQIASGSLSLNTSGNVLFVGTSQTNDYANMQLAELIYVAGAASAADRQRIEGYLARKWGLTASLPGGHPFQSQGPGCDLVVNAAGGDLIFQNILSGTRKMEKTGAGTVQLTGANSYIGMTTVSVGAIDGSASIPGGLTLLAGTTLAPGNGGTSIATLTTGAVTMNASSTYRIDLNGSTVTADRITSSGTVACAGTLTIASLSGTPVLNSTYIILSGTSISGTFSGLANNSTFVQQGRQFQISYGATTVTLQDKGP